VKGASSDKGEFILPEELSHLEKNLVEKIMGEILHHGQPVAFDDIAGLQHHLHTYIIGKPLILRF